VSVSDFFHMGGYGLYVWGSFGMSALLMAAEPVLLRRRRNDILKRLARIERLKQAEEQ
jgi:heme exporter protein D